MPPDYYQDLLQRYLDGKCSAREGEELFAWLASDAGRKPLLEALQRDYDNMVQRPGDTLPAAVNERIQARLEQSIRLHPGTRVRRLQRGWITSAAAVLVLGVGAYTWSRYERRPKPVSSGAPVAVQDVGPGGNKAMLTLGDGKTIDLNNAASGQLARQGGAGLVKTGAGQLAYTAVGTGAALYNTVSTPRGGQYQVVLADGTHVWLNASSSLHFPTTFTGKERRVILTGEAYFEVAPDVRQPFRVTVGDMDVAVLGTHFDVMAYTDEDRATTTLLEGAVQVSEGTSSSLVRPGQAASLDAHTHRLHVAPADLEGAVAWKNGYFRFDGVDLPVVMRQLSRWYDVDVDYQGRREKTYEFVGTVARSANLSSVLKVLEINGVQVKMAGKKLIVTP
jgi:ferric-dicitrate binding protein FerR (iron transport regulator)